ncbi:hypothetical protein BCR39DRAFT_513648 [Naematelia encephala]|uniref:precorrin-2 dehydrogenase n=1 Tax=Naematelia encephala TaxID=71784 RepID=A0A1Y2BIK4_9TREE|nr:hypothetical protein BCR39DRAFT_513648 [Naematelia encephala]
MGEMNQVSVRTPPTWVSAWFACSSIIVLWDAAYCFYRPRSFGSGDLAWIWWPYNKAGYSTIDLLYGQKALDEKDGFTNAQALLNVIEVILNLEYLYLRHTSPHRQQTINKDRRPRYHAYAPIVGFSGALMTLSKTALYFLQEYFCDWCMVGHNTRFKFWTIWVASNRTWVVVPFLVCVVLGSFITQSLSFDLANQIAYAEWADLQETSESASKPHVSEKQTDRKDSIMPASRPSTPTSFPSPQSGAALPLTFVPHSLPVVVIGSNRLAATRVYTLLEADADVVLISPLSESKLHPELQHRIKTSAVRYVRLDVDDLYGWAKWFSENDIALVCVTDTMIGSTSRRSYESAAIIAKAATSLHIPVNVSDQPTLSTFNFPSVHRFPGLDGKASHLQIAVSTNGHGCRLSGRIKRDIVARLPKDVGAAVDNVGTLRKRAQVQERSTSLEVDQDTPLNSPVPQLNGETLNPLETKVTRMRWVNQMSEYYSYSALANLTANEMDKALSTYRDQAPMPHHEAGSGPSSSQGSIYLVGSGPGHPGLLTMAAHHALTHATLILSDKLVPAEILALIPKSTALHIAKKFPGNAEGAQNEMMALALEGAQKGERVVRLKQGDPFVYGRGGEEVLFFREHGFECTLVPGISSALAGPLMSGIPVTQRGVAESMILCTGVGRQGKAVQLPGYIRSRSLVILMGVARLPSILSTLCDTTSSGRDGAAFPLHTPIAIIERASSPDQRVIASTLEHIHEAVQSVEERPPGMFLVGWSVLCLEGKGRVDVLDQPEDGDKEREKEIVNGWLGDKKWKVREGLGDQWQDLVKDLVI